MKTTKELMKELETKTAFHLSWSVMWRWFVIVIAFYTAILVLGAFLLALAGL